MTDIRKWIQDVHTYAESSVNIVLIGNKCDLDSKKVKDFCHAPLSIVAPAQVVPESKGRELAEEYGIHFFETSAKADINVQEAFGSLVNAVCLRLFADNATTKKPVNGTKTVTVDSGNSKAGSGGKCC